MRQITQSLILQMPRFGMDVVLSIIAPDGTMLVDELDEAIHGEPEVAQCVTLEQEGQYIVIVDEFWDMTAGEYSLEVSDCGDGSGFHRPAGQTA